MKAKSEKEQQLEVGETDLDMVVTGAIPSGVFIAGNVVARRRREVVNKSGQTRFLITMAILAKMGLFQIERWSETSLPEDIPVVGQEVSIPVKIGAYLINGQPRVRLEWVNEKTDGSF
jgi:hypothetical protein